MRRTAAHRHLHRWPLPSPSPLLSSSEVDQSSLSLSSVKLSPLCYNCRLRAAVLSPSHSQFLTHSLSLYFLSLPLCKVWVSSLAKCLQVTAAPPSSLVIAIHRQKNFFCLHVEAREAMGMVHEDQTSSQTQVAATTEQVEALLEAARYDDIEDVVNLFSIGVPLDSKDSDGRTALHMAAANGHLQIVEYLITNGVDLNATNSENNTPLHWACLNGHIEVVKALILGGADVSRLNRYERSAIDEVVSRGKLEVIDAVNTAIAQIELSGARLSS